MLMDETPAELPPGCLVLLLVFFAANMWGMYEIRLPRWLAGTALTGQSGMFDRFCVASQGYKALQLAPHIALIPSIALALTVLSFNWFGDGLRDALDPRMRK